MEERVEQALDQGVQEQQPAPDPQQKLWESLADNVRQDSRLKRRPTRVEILNEDKQPLDLAEVEAVFEKWTEKPENADIYWMRDNCGEKLYAYSETYIAKRHAELCIRIADGDYLDIMAETIREESRIYPRPTNLNCFLSFPFEWKQEEVRETAAQLCSSPVHPDIRFFTAADGAVYYLSDRFLSVDKANRIVKQWVYEKENP